MKLLIWFGIFIGGTVGGWVGAAMTHGDWLSAVSIILSGVGSIIGIWVCYKISQYYD